MPILYLKYKAWWTTAIYALYFIEQGVSMLSAVLKSDTAIDIELKILTIE